MHPLTLFLFFASCLSRVQPEDLKALDEFVNLHDAHYNYTLVKKEKRSYYIYEFLVVTINMTSQKWLDETEVDKPIWSHEMTIMYPYATKVGESCLLLLNPGVEEEEFPKSPGFSTKTWLAHIAHSTGSVVALMNQVPIQPLTFYKHPLGRENIMGLDIEAYSWWRFINDSSVPPEYLVQFPMVKAAVRAMDTITDYMNGLRKNTTKFTLTGFSINGLTTWLTAAVDKRVAAIIPIAMDFLNFTENFLHQYKAYCGWSYGLKPFYDLNITQKLVDPRFTLLASHLDPIAYNERYTSVVKFIIDLSGDTLFQPDNSHYYFPQLEGEKYLHIVPNANYEFQRNKALIHMLTVLHYQISKNQKRPIISWQRTMTNTTGIIDLQAGPDVYEVFCYQADTVGDARRDFRMKIASGDSTKRNPVKWTKSPAEKINWSTYRKELEIPKKGWRAFFLQVIFTTTVNNVHLILTSELHIIPDTFPCPDCSKDEDEDGCHGTLV